MVVNADRSNDQFVWSPSTGRVRRVDLRGVGVMGTDYTFDDIAWKNIEDADYQRLAVGQRRRCLIGPCNVERTGGCPLKRRSARAERDQPSGGHQHSEASQTRNDCFH